MKTLTLILVLLSAVNGFARPFDPFNNPNTFKIIETKYSNLAKRAKVSMNAAGPWSSDYWSNKKGSLNHIPKNQKYSPLEKWQMAGGGPGLNKQVEKILSHEDVPWSGLCHGVSAAALVYPEPIQKTVSHIKFKSSDIKAYLGAYYDYLIDNKLITSKFIGSTCFNNLTGIINVGQLTFNECDDLNAGAFHLALHQRLAVEKKGFVVDLERQKPIFNHPVIGFDSELIGNYQYWYPVKDDRTVRTLHIKTKLTFLEYITPETDSEVPGEEGQILDSKTYEYTLELDSEGNIVGGEWITFNHPDFIWYSPKFPKPSGDWEFLNNFVKFD